MKTIKTTFVIIMLVTFIIGCTNQQPINTDNTQNLRTAEIELPGMFCLSCAYSSKNSFLGMDGVIDADVDIDTKKGTVIYDSTIISKEQLVDDGLIKAYGGNVVDDAPYTP